ncbi:MAG: glycosyl transferase family 1 [Planctomycetaceae bacterium]|nr:MAG: glycosyl transferase family 1 [Planctomycetaceae bacterium]
MKHLAIVTAGGAGMYCGSCIYDNTWARALKQAGWQVTLIPLYTPLTLDDRDETSTRIFYGGINVYLDEYLPGWKFLPRWLTRWLDAPWLLRLVSQRGVSNQAAELGRLTVDLLKGAAGPQAVEGAQFVRFISRELRPDLVCFSNLMLAAEIDRLKAEWGGPVWSLLQGDDIFLEGLLPDYREQAVTLLRQIASRLDGVITHGRAYAQQMSELLRLPIERFRLLPLAIDCAPHSGRPRPAAPPYTIGYFARIAPEKGFREFCQAAAVLRRQRSDVRFLTGGYLPPQHRGYFEQAANLMERWPESWEYAGSPMSVEEKSRLLQRFDLLSVPAPYHDPKGLYVLEAWANGVPVVVPKHGHLGELLTEIPAGLTVDQLSPETLAETWSQLLDDETKRRQLAELGWRKVRERHDLPAVAQATAHLFAHGAESTSCASHLR